MVTNPSADVISRLEEVSEKTHVLSTDTADSHLKVWSRFVFYIHDLHLCQVVRIVADLAEAGHFEAS